mmetsp:Transcript_20280/g.28078  ORF Transcript_20280/g.28078 Transcript_20280/m.28078 type:complete len:207 (-) Transcript_20280:8-628(-)
MRKSMYIIRHGRSLANERGVIVSELINGEKKEFGLAPVGVRQAEEAGRRISEELSSAGQAADQLVFFSSPFSRALQTARVVMNTLELPPDHPLEIAPELRERYFGPELELGPHSGYDRVWAADRQDPSSPAGGSGESVQEVAERLQTFFSKINDAHPNSVVVLVSHGDTLQIAQSVLLTDGSAEVMKKHRDFAMETGEVRILNNHT